MSAEKTYEMLWDCAYCGAQKLLGLSHRHCPGCGAAQDADARYFPLDEEKVAVEDHPFVGADRECPACSRPSSASACNCGGCGAPLDGASEVARRSDRPAPPEAAPAADRPGGNRHWAWLLGGACVLALAAGVGIVRLWTQDVSLEVAGHSWERRIEIESVREVAEERWCDEIPADAYRVSRRREVRRHEKVAKGEDCSTRRSDRGDGTFSETQECKARFEQVPVYDEKCSYTLKRWKTQRWLEARGNQRTPAPHWPELDLVQTGTCIGCEREGSRQERYSLRFVGPDAQAECDQSQDVWTNVRLGDTWGGEAGVVLSEIRCDSLAPTKGTP